ncbi:MAG: enoyl-CoA hydratase-related protein [Bacteroidota bacterium]
MSTFETLLYTIDADGIATITINRPDKLNALSHQVMGDLDAAFSQARTDDAVKGVILTGSGPKSFVAGADIKQFTSLNALDGHHFAVRGQAVFGRIEGMTKPVVAAVNGYALGGGCELAIACHLRVASENAIFGQPEVKLGIIPGYGGTQRLPRLVGHGLATELVLTGEHIGAQRAYEIGLVNHVVPAEGLLAKAKALLMSIVTKAPLAVAMSLDALQAASLPLQEGLKYEAALFGQACATEDFAEGAAAFLERRQATFKGR